MKKKIAIITPALVNFDRGYSVAGVVLDQAVMLARYGHEVHLYVNERWSGGGQFKTIKKLPFIRLFTYKSRNQVGRRKLKGMTVKDLAMHKKCPLRMAKMLTAEMSLYDFIFTHDIIFHMQLLPYYLGLEKAVQTGRLKKQRWLHWIHSLPPYQCDWWDLRKLGRQHRIVYPNRADRHQVSRNFQGRLSDVCVIPHIRDLRLLASDASSESNKFIDRYPGVMEADIVQVYPANSSRMKYKRVRELILIFYYLKRLGFSICLVIANQYAYEPAAKKNIKNYQRMIKRLGLSGAEVIFTSEHLKDWRMEVPQSLLFNLMRYANLFIFPTRDESFGLVLPEALLMGGCLPVINKDLEVHADMLRSRGLRFRFGTQERNLSYRQINGGKASYLQYIASEIARQIVDEESIAARTICRQTLNMDAIYKKYYLPIIEGATNV